MKFDRKLKITGLFLGLVSTVVGAQTDISTVPLNTYTATSSVDVKPNIMFILDDSGSMDWDYAPDEANSSNQTRRRNAGFNGMAYNPATVYKPPIRVNSSGVSDTTTYKNMTGESTTTGGNSSATSASRNWSQVKNDAYGVQSTGTSDLTPSTSLAPYFYTTIPGEYCKSASLRECNTQSAPTTTYSFPAYLRWCNSSSVCKAGYESGVYNNVRMPAPRTSTITITGSSSTSVTGITVNSLQIMSGATTADTSRSTVADRIVAKINDCTYVRQGTCQVEGYTAERSGDNVIITAPDASTYTPVVSKSGGMTLATVAFSAGTVPGENLRTTITPAVTSYPYPGSTTKASSRSDCAGTTCTYNEEMTNYANWWTYYRTRMQLMKTAASNAFAAIDTTADIAAGKSRFRLGYMSLNNNTNTDFVNLGEFSGTQKGTWFDKLVKANPDNGTPLRRALSDAGRLYAGKLNGTSYNGVTVTEPLQYSCQKNFTLLSTDGFWNGAAGYKLDGSTAIGNQDAGLAAPYGDGGTAQLQARTSTLQTASLTPQYNRRTNNLERRTMVHTAAPPWQGRISTNSGSTWGAWFDDPSCAIDSSGTNRKQCRYPYSTSTNSGTTWSAWAYTAANTSCTPDTSGTSRTACETMWTAWSDVSSCTASSTVQCQYEGWSSWSVVGSCTAVSQSTASPYVGPAVQCTNATPLTGTWSNATGTCTKSSTNDCRYTNWSSWSNVSACTAVAQSTGPTTYSVLTARECQSTSTGGVSDTLADVAAYYYSTDLRNAAATGVDATGTCTGPIIAPNTTANDLCADNATANGRDTAKTQHMTTFTLGLGANGKMIYAPADGKDYWNDGSGDFYDVYKKTTADSSTGICSWQSSGTCYWPTPASDSNANIDDMWHAAVNGRGTYFSAKDANSLTSSLTSLLNEIVTIPRPGTAAAAASSNPNVSSSDNYVFSSSYESVSWYGEMVRQEIGATGALSAQNWSAMRLLDCATTPWQASKAYVTGDVYRQGSYCYLVLGDYTSGATFDDSSTGADGVGARKLMENEAGGTTPVTAKTSRTIYTHSGASLIPFTWAELGTAGLDGYFTETYLSSRLSQFCVTGTDCLSSTAKTAASGETLVNYLRGERTNESTYYRKRAHVLGDIVSSEGRYVKAPLFNYFDTGYSSFKASMQSRKGAVYVGANDGMLHAFDAATGQELWAYIPPAVIPNLHKLADKNYAANHQYFVDNTPEVGEIAVACTPVAPATTCVEWKTILVGGLNRGGSSYYALDITDPDSPKYLWSYASSTMGYSYGNPRITKLKNGTWVVILSSGYNNTDGQGYVYVLNAYTGALINTIGTGTGTASVPASIARISAHTPTADTNNTVRAVYGGDLQGNLWRFDVNGDLGATGTDAQRLITFVDAANQPQPITARPTVATISGYPVIFVGTGKYLGVTDITNTQFQSFYAVKDASGSTAWSNPRLAGSGFVKQILTASTCPTDAPVSVCSPGEITRSVTSNAVDWTSNNGWYLDFLTGGERAYTDAALGLGTLLFTTNLPSLTSASVCGDPSTSGAKSFLYGLNYLTGGALSNSYGVAAISLGDGNATRPVMIKLADGSVRALTRVSTGLTGGNDPNKTDLGTTKNTTAVTNTGSGAGLRRVSWRELLMQ